MSGAAAAVASPPKAGRNPTASPSTRTISSPRPITSSNLSNNGSATPSTTASFILNPKAVPFTHKQIEHVDDVKKLDAAYFSRYDISKNFLDSVESMTKNEFERSTMEEIVRANAANNNTVQNKSSRSLQKRGQPPSTDGLRFFGMQSIRGSRPNSVPSPFVRKVFERSRPGTTIFSGARPPSKQKVLLTQPKSGIPKLIPSASAVDSEDFSNATTSDAERPDSASSAKRVTFAADVVNYERESKPSKRRKLPKRRKQGFPHPSRGIFIPPEWEIVDSPGPVSGCRENPYLNFTQVWTHPASRNVGESNTALVIRKERFHRVMTDLEHAHHHYNRLSQEDQDVYLIQCIFKRYILALDLALTDANITQIEHLLETIENSSRVLQRSMHALFFDSNGLPKETRAGCERFEHPDIILITYALGRITEDLLRPNLQAMCVETILVKLCFELMALVFAPKHTRVFRIALAALPLSAHQAVSMFKDMLLKTDSLFYIGWINNSAVQRDFRSVLKTFELLDRYGCKSEVPDVELPSMKRRQSGKTGAKRTRPSSATVATTGMQRPRSNSR